MPSKRISKDIIVHGATQLIEEKGYGNFTLHELAFRLGVKPSSLYNHMRNMEDLKKAIRICAIEKMQNDITESVAGKDGKEALLSTAIAVRIFAKENRELYKTIFSVGPGDGGIELTSLLDANLSGFTLTNDEAVHFTRAFCSSVFGFIMLENAGYFASSGNTDNSFIAMVALLISSLKTV